MVTDLESLERLIYVCRALPSLWRGTASALSRDSLYMNSGRRWIPPEIHDIEVLQHSSNHHENHVLSHKGKGQMCPAEVIVLYVEVLFACSTLIIKCNDVFLDVMMFFSVDVRLLVSIQRYVYITPNVSVCSLPCLPSLSFKAQL